MKTSESFEVNSSVISRKSEVTSPATTEVQHAGFTKMFQKSDPLMASARGSVRSSIRQTLPSDSTLLELELQDL